MNERYKNPYFYFGLVGVIIAAMGVSPETLTSWDALQSSVLSMVSNPVQLAAVIVAITGVFVNPTTKGLKDK